MKTMLNQFNNDSIMESSMDVEMEDVSGGGGFKRAGGGQDFSFMKRKVRVNAVDKDIKEYQLD
jgi:hypothetical protein